MLAVQVAAEWRDRLSIQGPASFPADVYCLATEMGVRLRRRPISRAYCFARADGQISVTLPEGLARHREAEKLLHELGHVAMDHAAAVSADGLRAHLLQEDRRDVEASRFAVEFLAPASWLCTQTGDPDEVIAALPASLAETCRSMLAARFG